MTEQVEVKENLLTNDHDTPERVVKPSTSIPRFQNKSDSQTSTPMFLRPSLLPSSSSFGFEIGQRKPDTPRPTSKSFCLNPSRLSLNASTSTSKSSSASNQNDTETEETQPKKEVPIPSPPAVFGAVVTKTRTQKPDEISLASGFIFGQNLHERVELNKEADSTSEDDKKPNDTQEAEVSSSSNVISPSFGNLKHDEPEENGKLDESVEESKRKLVEAAKEYEESRATKRKYEEVDCMTGEENDVNVFQLNICKLYVYDNAKSNWVEKGRGQLRVNDMDGGQSSRVVMRNNGNLKVILNTKIWADMNVEKVSEKSVRLTAFEEDSIKVFLVLGPAKSIDEFIHVLLTRVERHKEADRKRNPTTSKDEDSLEDRKTSNQIFLRPSLLQSPSSFAFKISQRNPDIPRTTFKSFCSNTYTSTAISKSSSFSNLNNTETEETQHKKEVPIPSPPAVFGAVVTKNRTQKPDEILLASDFIFGQNLHERVELNKKSDSTSEDDKKPNDILEAEVSSSSNIISPSFGNLKNDEPEKNGKLIESVEESKRKLVEAAKEYEESRATKRKYEEADCMTGEENDVKVFQLNLCKLYVYDNAKSNWVEKGRGQLRVNDMDGGQSSRVVMRNNGNLKVILNTKIWADMNVEKVSEKSVRLTAFEEDSIKVFLVLGPAKRIDEFLHVLLLRVKRSKEADIKRNPTTPKDKDSLVGTLV